MTAISQVNVTGVLAQMGRGMVQDVSDQMFQVSRSACAPQLESGAPAVSAPPTSGQALGSPTTPAPEAPASPEALDLGSLGAKVAGRAVVRGLTAPTPLWVALLIAAVVVYLLVR